MKINNHPFSKKPNKFPRPPIKSSIYTGTSLKKDVDLLFKMVEGLALEISELKKRK